MTAPNRTEMRLYDEHNERLYLNRDELDRFLAAAYLAPPAQRRFALTLAYTGMRISEAIELTGDALQPDACVVSVRTLKKRKKVEIREIPLPPPLQSEFAFQQFAPGEHVWSKHGRPICRSRAYRWIKLLMEDVGITGPRACPKGLRHAFGVRAVMSKVPLHILQKWMGHASMETTAIYASVLGPDQLAMSDWMWGIAPDMPPEADHPQTHYATHNRGVTPQHV